MRFARAGRTAAVAVTGLAAAGVLATAATVGDEWFDRWTGAEATALAAANREVAVQPAPVALVCPRGVELPEGADVGDEQFGATPVGTESWVRAVVAGAAGTPGLTRLDGSDAAPMTQGPDAAVGADDGPLDVITGEPEPSAELRVAGATASVTTAGDLRGLAAASCRAPATEHWLVGGDSEVGSSAVLTVRNPSDRPAAVTLDVLGPTGQVPVGGQGAFTLAPGEQTAVRLDSLAPEQRRLAVHVQAAGARVTASLQTQGIDGLLPAGTDVVEPGSAPARSVVVTGVLADGAAADDPHAAELWLAAPTDAGTARITVLGPGGPVTLRGAETVVLEPGVVTPVPLGGLDAGTYTVVVDADVPVVGAARFAVAGVQPEDSVIDGTPYDVAWSAARALPEAGEPSSSQVALPSPAQQATVVLTGVPADRSPDGSAEGETGVTLRGLDADGALAGEQEVAVPVGGTVEVPAADLGAVAAVTVDVPAVDAADRPADAPAAVTWSVRVAASDGTAQDGTLVATLDPTATLQTPGEVVVRRVDAP
ncbi:DUF5719 family protein [Isoptericola jiangsuensis]|uniref:DUF5719 family protein n=1 Tax=Isoptericola jiangsuensis TaxID=548579 RepID=UPI003AAA6CAC